MRNAWCGAATERQGRERTVDLATLCLSVIGAIDEISDMKTILAYREPPVYCALQ